jgi:hypothetical protein
MGKARALLRALASESPKLDTIDALIAERDAIDGRQGHIMRANLAIIDQDRAMQKVSTD